MCEKNAVCNETMRRLGSHRSVIRELFEYGKARKALIGEENVFDFSIGNPCAPTPDAVRETLVRLLEQTDPVVLHGYTSAQGDFRVRCKIAEDLNRRFQAEVNADFLYLTAGASASLTCALTALLSPGDEVILLSPYFPEYRVFVERTGAKVCVVPCNDAFQPDLVAIAASIHKNTRALLINSPNNPTGAIIPSATLSALAALLQQKEKEIGHPLYLIADEPYRELTYEGREVPWVAKFHNNTIVCYSYSKCLSLPGERIGYVLVNPKATESGAVYEAICGAGRALGFVCAPSLFQYLLPDCLALSPDLSLYEKNRKILYQALTAYGFSSVPPDGAFYLFVRSPEPDAKAFCERAKKYELLLVPSDDFGCPGYVRIAYCVTEAQIIRSLPAFQSLAASYGLCQESGI